MDGQPEASPLKNMTGGGGCGCGCLGLLMALAGGLALASIPLGFWVDGDGSPFAFGIGAIVSGILLFLLGTSVYIGSLFLD
ncbi:MAG: hypothetical protein ABMB14_21560 [Myxococcota bacterium]